MPTGNVVETRSRKEFARMSVTAATALTLWSAAHAGGGSPDATIAALNAHMTAGVRRAESNAVADPTATVGTMSRHVRQLPEPGAATTSVGSLLPIMRSGTPTLLLPRAGDVRGLPPQDAALRTAAVAAGAAVSFPDAQVTVVPRDGVWWVYDGVGRTAHADRSVALADLDDAVANATTLFTAGDLGVDAADARALIASQVQQRTVPIPPQMPSRATVLLDRCVHLEAIVAVAAGHRTAAVNLWELGMVSQALQPLADAARQARIAAVADAVASLRPSVRQAPMA